MAEPGSVTSPPSPPPPSKADQTRPSPPPSSTHPTDDTDKNVESDTEDEPSAPEFVPGKCLFCEQESSTLDDNMTHMATAHGFTVPFQDFLAVDLETVVAFLHFVIYAYRECICCGMRRGTVQGVQQHMLAKGHCRFDVSQDTEEFYELPQSESIVEQTQRDGSMEVRLPSGKLISHRKNQEPQEPRPARRATPDRPGLDAFASRSGPSSSAPGNEVIQRQTANRGGEIMRSNEAILAAQLSRLRIAGDRAQRKEEERKRGRLESATNSIMMKRFRLDAGDGRIGRQFG